MRLRMIAVLALMAVLSAAPALAFGGGGGHHDAIASSGSVTVGSTTTAGGGTTGGTVAATSEPLALFAVGLGLLGARYLRRR